MRFCIQTTQNITKAKSKGNKWSLGRELVDTLFACFLLLHAHGSNLHSPLCCHKITDRLKSLWAWIWITGTLMLMKDHSPDWFHTNQPLPFLFWGGGVRKEELSHSCAHERLKDGSDSRWENRHFLLSLVQFATADSMDQTTTMPTHTSRISKQLLVLKLLCSLL